MAGCQELQVVVVESTVSGAWLPSLKSVSFFSAEQTEVSLAPYTLDLFSL